MDRHKAREEAFKLLFQIDINEDSSLHHEQMNSFTNKLTSGVISNKENIDSEIKEHLVNWSFDRLALVEKTILRIATYEMMYLDDIPVGVSINEAVELAHKYGDEKSGKFVNGVLSKIIAK